MLERLTKGSYVQLMSGIYLAMFLIRVAFGIVVITFGHFVRADDFIYGLLVASSPLLELVTVVFAGPIVDRYGRKGVLLAGLSLGAFSLYALALVSDEQWFALWLINAIHGVAAAFILVTTLAIIASVAPPESRGREMGLFNFANMFGWIFGFALGSYVYDLFGGWGLDIRYSFILAGFLATLGLVYGHLNVHEPARPGGVERADFRELARVFSNRRVLVLSAAWLIVFMFIGSLVAFFPRVMADCAVDFSGGAVAFWILVVGVGFIGSQIVFGRLSDRYGREALMLAGALGFIGLIVTALLGYLVDTSTGSCSVTALLGPRAPLIALFALITLAFAPAALAALADEAPQNTEGTTMSVYSIVLNLGMIFGPIVVGAVVTQLGALAVIAFFLSLGALLLACVATRIAQVGGLTARRASPAARDRTPEP